MATVRDLYQQILGREPEPAGLLYWESQFGGQIDPAEAARFQSVAASELAQREAEAAAASNVAAAAAAGTPNIEALYAAQLGRAADPEGLAYWSNKFGREVDANELAQFQIEAAKEIAGRTTGVRPPVVPVVRPPVTPVPVAPRPVVPGGVSPYEQVMGQMRPLGNPYAGIMANQAMGGYNPALYSQIAAADAARAAAGNVVSSDTSYSGGMAKGGMVHGGVMFGANPPGPDDGAVNLDLGEYVIKKSAVDKYGKGLLDMINEGKVPAKKMKSLLG